METVLGISMAPTTVQMALSEGENLDRVTVDEENVERTGAGPTTRSGPDQVIAAILGTRQGAAESGYQLLSTGVPSPTLLGRRRCVTGGA